VDLKFRDTLPQTVVDELDQLLPKLRQYLYSEHDADGAHTDVTADSVSLQGAKAGEVIDLPYDAARYYTNSSSVWTVSSANQIVLRYTRIGQLVVLNFVLDGTIIATDTPSDGLHIRLPELHAIPARSTSGTLYASGIGTAYYNNITQVVTGICGVQAFARDYAGVVPSTDLEIFGMTVAFASLPVTMHVEGTVSFFVEPNNVATPYYGS